MDVNGGRFQHRVLLLKISQKLTKSDLEELLYLAEEVLSESGAQKITSVISLFRELQHRAYLGPNNYDFIRVCLLSIGRHDLADMLPTKEEENLAQTLSELSFSSTKKPCSTPDQKKLLLSISDQLRVEDVKKMAYLCSCEASEGLELVQMLEKKGLIGNNNYNYISEALTEIGRRDLGKQLEASAPIKTVEIAQVQRERIPPYHSVGYQD